MSPLALNHPSDTTLDGSDEQIISFLVRSTQDSRLPKNVFDDINPYQYHPSDLPDGIWYLVNSTEKKGNKFGFWVVKEEGFEIFMNSSISGWKRTLEFLDSVGSRTDWMMQEYWITKKGQYSVNKGKEHRAICRVFPHAPKSSNKEMQLEMELAAIDGLHESPGMPSTSLIIETISRKGSTSESVMNTNVDGTKLPTDVDELLDPHLRETTDLLHLINGDYLELDDLADPLSRAFSSDNSSRSSLSSDAYFDSIALLQELENNKEEQQGKDSNSRFSIAASSRPFEVVMQPGATSESIVSANGTEEQTVCKQEPSVIETKHLDHTNKYFSLKRMKAEQEDEGSSSSRGVASFASTPSSTSPRGDEGPLSSRGVAASALPGTPSSTSLPGDEGPSSSRGVAASALAYSGTSPPAPKGEKKAAVVKTKSLKKYFFCFLF